MNNHLLKEIRSPDNYLPQRIWISPTKTPLFFGLKLKKLPQSNKQRRTKKLKRKGNERQIAQYSLLKKTKKVKNFSNKRRQRSKKAVTMDITLKKTGKKKVVQKESLGRFKIEHKIWNKMLMPIKNWKTIEKMWILKLLVNISK